MKNLFTATSLVALLAATPAWAQNTAHPHHPAPNQNAANSQKSSKTHGSKSLNNQDEMFIGQAADGNLLQLDLGRLAIRKATNPAVQILGRWMVADSHYANARLDNITKEIGKAKLFHPRLTLPNQQVQQELGMLSGNQFNRQYVNMMVRDHQRTIPRFRQEEQYGKNPSLKTYAHNLLPVLHQQLAAAERLSITTSVATGMGTSPPASGSSLGR
jgi:putative membrane protein